VADELVGGFDIKCDWPADRTEGTFNLEDRCCYPDFRVAADSDLPPCRDPRTLRRAYDFIRSHEKNGLYIPPRLIPDKKILKAYHDQLPYDDDDAPSSNQGFHCGALLAAQELGFPVTDDDISRAIGASMWTSSAKTLPGPSGVRYEIAFQDQPATFGSLASG
jgi:hypothetical protein